MYDINFVVINYDNNQWMELHDFPWITEFGRVSGQEALTEILARTDLTKERINFFLDFSYIKYTIK